MAQATLAETVHCILNQIAQNAATSINLLATDQNTVPLFHISLLKLLLEHQPYLKRGKAKFTTPWWRNNALSWKQQNQGNTGPPWLAGDFQQALMLIKPQMGTNKEWGIFWLKVLGWRRKVMPWTRLWPLQGSTQIQSLESHSLFIMLSSSFVTVQILTVIPCSGNWLTLMFINLVQFSRKALWVCMCVWESPRTSLLFLLYVKGLWCNRHMLSWIHSALYSTCRVKHRVFLSAGPAPIPLLSDAQNSTAQPAIFGFGLWVITS